jgi:hypothetical protein
MKIDFSLGKCKTKATFSAKLKHPQKLNLDNIKKRFKVVLDTPILLVINVRNVELIVHGYGELLFKECEDMNLMNEIALVVYEEGLCAGSSCEIDGN